jgi:hypothetical protein
VKCLSKTTWKINQEGKLTVTAKKNGHLLWWNGRQMMNITTSVLQLQVGDVISVGKNAETPWLEFHVKKMRAVVTPPTDVAKMPSPLSRSARERRTARTNLKSRRRLFSGHHQDRYRSEESSLDETENSHVCSTVHETEMGNTDAVMTRDADSEDESQDTSNHATKHTRKEKNSMSSRRTLLSSQDENLFLPAISVMEETQQKQTQPVIDNHHAESRESSILSLPQCPTWEDESQNYTGTNSIDSCSVQKPCSYNEARLEQHPSDESRTTSGESSQGHNVIFATMLSLSQWKQIRQDNNVTGSIRGALASLVVAQRVRDPKWFPAILEGAVVEGDVMVDANES